MNAYQALEQIFAKIGHLQHLQAIAGWDEAVMMPVGGGKARAQAMAGLNTVMHEMLTQSSVGNLIQQAKNEILENDWQKRNLALMEKKYNYAICIPPMLVQHLTESAMTSEQAWRRLRAENNWHDFTPFFKKTLHLVKEIAAIKADVFKKSAYDVLLDEFSPDINQQFLDPIFTELKQTLPNLVQQIVAQQKHETVQQPDGIFAIEKQRQLGLALMSAIGFDFKHGRLDVSHHPFCGGVPRDVRVTTRYREDDFITSAMAICHETGHARYEQGLPDQWLTQPVGEPLGMSVHESQSLLVEMQACRTQEFMQFLAPLTQKYFGEQAAFNPQNLYRLYTRVRPGYIRVDADEATYPLHVILRYEIEKELIAGNLTVDDLPEVWDQKMQTYLGLSTKNNYRDGVMQDVHWPSGAFGYFPAYTLGSLIAAQLFATAKKAHPQVLAELARGNFATLFQWLGAHIHSKASSLPFAELIKSATGEALNPNFFIQHIKTKYLTA